MKAQPQAPLRREEEEICHQRRYGGSAISPGEGASCGVSGSSRLRVGRGSGGVGC